MKKFNAAAKALDPDSEPLDWSEVSHYSFIEEFALLQDTRKDLRGNRVTSGAYLLYAYRNPWLSGGLFDDMFTWCCVFQPLVWRRHP